MIKYHEGGRHTAVSLNHDARAREDVSMREAGHSDRATHQRYNHPLIEAHQEAAEKRCSAGPRGSEVLMIGTSVPRKFPQHSAGELARRVRQCVSAAQAVWGGWGSNPRPADYESANPRPRSSSDSPAYPVLPAHEGSAGPSGDGRGRAIHRTGVPIVFPSGRWSQ